MVNLSCKTLIYHVYNKGTGNFEMKLLLMILSVTFMVCGVAELVMYYAGIHTYEVL